MKPTTIGNVSTAAPVGVATVPRPVTALAPSAPLNTGSIVLREEQRVELMAALAKLDFMTMPGNRVVTLGFEAERGLHQTLDGFLARLDKQAAAQVFALFERLDKGVKEANLPDLLAKIQQGDQLGWRRRLLGRFRGKNAQTLARDAVTEVRELISGRTKTLADEMGQVETELRREMERLFTELGQLDQLKRAYAEHLQDFALAAALTQAFLAQARVAVTEKAEQVATQPDVLAQAELQELRDKLQLLESRALALEGAYTKLPADQLVIQQISQAGVATLQETATTAATRFASIKTTLLALHGAFAVQGVQNLSAKAAKMESQLATVRGALTKQVVATAATAPGDNRLAQVAQIEAVIKETHELHGLVTAARQSNEEKFEEARRRFAEMRSELATLQQ